MTKWSVALMAVISAIAFLCTNLTISEINAEPQASDQEIKVEGLLDMIPTLEDGDEAGFTIQLTDEGAVSILSQILSEIPELRMEDDLLKKLAVSEGLGITTDRITMSLDVTMLTLPLYTIPACSVLDAILESRKAE